MISRLAAFVILSSLLCASAIAENGRMQPNSTDTAAWTVLVYLAADNDLEHWALVDFNEMEVAGSSPQVNVVVQFDRHPAYDNSDGNWSDTRRYYVTHDTDPNLINSIRLDTLPPLGELDMGDPQTLIDFVNWGVDNFPARRYAVFAWNHGDGWYKRTPSREPLFKGFGVDQSTPDSNQIGVANGEYATALSAITNHLGRKIDLLGFDACLMQMWEVQDISSHYADYLVGSEEAEYLEGWNHTLYVQALNSNPAMTAPQLGAAVANASIDGSTLNTMSCVDLSRVGGVTTAVSNFACKLRAASENPTLKQYIYNLRWDLITSNQSYLYMEHTDLYRFAEVIYTSAYFPYDLHVSAGEVMAAVGNAVTHNRYSAAPDYSWSHGIAIYYPYETSQYNAHYWQLPIASTTSWAQFISGTTSSLKRGDANGDGAIDISDVVYLIAYIFSGGPGPDPVTAGDASCDAAVDISDAVYLIAYIFSGGLPPCGGC